MAGKGGGSWKVAYADFVTAMMAFFMVMWITAQNQEAKKAVSNYFQDPFAKPGEGNGPVSALDGGGPVINRKGDHGRRPGVKTAPSESSGLGTTIQFAPSSAELSDEAKHYLASLAPELSGIPQRVEIRGHAWRAPLAADSGFADPWALSYARCLATMQFLLEHGVEAERMRLSQAGVFQPATTAESSVQQLENERVEVFVLREFVSPASGLAKKKDDHKEPPPHSAHEEEQQAHEVEEAHDAGPAPDPHHAAQRATQPLPAT